MIATHNIKVNGRWYAAGEEVPEEKEQKVEKKPAKVTEEHEVPKVEEKAEAEKPRSATRRKVSK